MRQERPEPTDGLPAGRSGETRQAPANAPQQAFRGRKLGWLLAELVLAAIVFGIIFSAAGCVIVQSVPDDRGRAVATPVAPSARIILEDRRPVAPAPAELPPK